jgi:AbrB family looped-hinge helix DNA binding protein
MSLKLRRTISRSGRGLVLRIPKDVENTLELKEGQEVDIWVENGKLIIEPSKKTL